MRKPKPQSRVRRWRACGHTQLVSGRTQPDSRALALHTTTCCLEGNEWTWVSEDLGFINSEWSRTPAGMWVQITGQDKEEEQLAMASATCRALHCTTLLHPSHKAGRQVLTARETEAQGYYTTCPRTSNQYAAQLDSTPGSFTRSPRSRVLSHGAFLAMGHTEAPGIHFRLCDGASSHWAVRCGSWQCTWRGPAGSRLRAYGLSLTADWWELRDSWSIICGAGSPGPAGT